MKQFASWFTHGVPGGGALRKQIFESKNGPAVLDAVERFFEAQTLNHDSESLPLEPDESMLTSAAYCD
jgi:hypothetical protein